jgi:hypothetical protein
MEVLIVDEPYPIMHVLLLPLPYDDVIQPTTTHFTVYVSM